MRRALTNHSHFRALAARTAARSRIPPSPFRSCFTPPRYLSTTSTPPTSTTTTSNDFDQTTSTPSSYDPTTLDPTIIDTTFPTAEILVDPHISPALWPFTDNAIWLVQTVHETSGLPWFAAIAGTTVAMRTLLFPLAIKAMKNGAKLAEVAPEMQRIQAKLKGARGEEEKMAYTKEMQSFMKDKGVRKNIFFCNPTVEEKKRCYFCPILF